MKTTFALRTPANRISFIMAYLIGYTKVSGIFIRDIIPIRPIAFSAMDDVVKHSIIEPYDLEGV